MEYKLDGLDPLIIDTPETSTSALSEKERKNKQKNRDIGYVN